MEKNTEIQLSTQVQNDLKALIPQYLIDRGINNPEFETAFKKTALDMIYSQSAEGLEAIKKARPLSLLNAVFVASEIGASFAKKEISVLPFAISKSEKQGDAIVKTKTGENDLTIVVDINFQKQLIHKMPNCKRFFTAEVKDGVEVYTDMTTGNRIFEGQNKATAKTVGYYACFIDNSGEKYDLFMTCAEIVERAKCNPNVKLENYKKTENSIHYEKIVVRNLLKEIPRTDSRLSSVIANDEAVEYTPHEVIEDVSENKLEAAKKEIVAQEAAVSAATEQAEATGEAAPVKFF